MYLLMAINTYSKHGYNIILSDVVYLYLNLQPHNHYIHKFTARYIMLAVYIDTGMLQRPSHQSNSGSKINNYDMLRYTRVPIKLFN